MGRDTDKQGDSKIRTLLRSSSALSKPDCRPAPRACVYRDEQGNVLQGADHDEAAALHRDQPDAATWRERLILKQPARDLERLRQEAAELRRWADAHTSHLTDEQRAEFLLDQQASLDRLEREFLDKIQFHNATHAATPATGKTKLA
jgi:hypothetical protein